jgi:hypothetical protein
MHMTGGESTEYGGAGESDPDSPPRADRRAVRRTAGRSVTDFALSGLVLSVMIGFRCARWLSRATITLVMTGPAVFVAGAALAMRLSRSPPQ